MGKAPNGTPGQPNKIYWYGGGGNILMETDGAGENRYWDYFFNGVRIGRREPTNWIDHYGLDALGNVRWFYGPPTGLWDDSDYYPFGGERVYLSHSNNPYKFTGKERDSESGLDYFGARYNSSSLGRFMSPDWSENPTPVPYASLPYPQSLNLYSYVQNNPLMSTDPNGHCTVDGEKHNWLWCAAHSAGFTETKKETAAREKREAEVHEFLREHPEYLRQYLNAFMTVFTMAATSAGGLVPEEGSTSTPEEAAAAEAGAAAGTEVGVARTMVNGVPQPAPEGEIIVAPNGAAVKIPAGYVAEPAANGNGIVYRPAGTTGNANIIRVSGPDSRNPTGYIRIYNSKGQPVVPSSGKPGSNAQTHIPQ